MLTMTGAILQHVFRLMTFRHDGRGLPAARGGALYILMGLAALSRLGVDYVDPEGLDLVNSVATCAAYVALLSVLVRPTPMAAMLLISLFGNVVTGALYLAGISNAYATTALLVWEFAAVMSVLSRMVMRAQAEHKNRNTGKN
ncbi:hypothetical protein WJ97_13155 [Burkholderia ubonensis]|nr:hypothetical protein WJ97_13155 [Burkholderia ubonensis]